MSETVQQQAGGISSALTRLRRPVAHSVETVLGFVAMFYCSGALIWMSRGVVEKLVDWGATTSRWCWWCCTSGSRST